MIIIYISNYLYSNGLFLVFKQTGHDKGLETSVLCESTVNVRGQVFVLFNHLAGL